MIIQNYLYVLSQTENEDIELQKKLVKFCGSIKHHRYIEKFCDMIVSFGDSQLSRDVMFAMELHERLLETLIIGEKWHDILDILRNNVCFFNPVLTISWMISLCMNIRPS